MTFRTGSTATVTNVSAGNTTTQLLGANGSRVAAIITNASSAVMYVLLGSGNASNTNFTKQLLGNSTQAQDYELPGNYNGPVQAIWASATGQANITEIT